MQQFLLKARDPISSLTHLIGAFLSVIATIMLTLSSIIQQASWLTILSVTIFGVSLVALYSASAYYHFIYNDTIREKHFRKVDHAMIYVLIAGTYTPICLRFMEEPHGLIFISIIWLVAIAGIIVKVFWMNAPRWLSTSLYLLLGWAIVFDIKAIQGIPSACLWLIALGGVAYSVGAVIYMFKKPNFSPQFGFHELFHIFILLGSLLHFMAVWLYVI